MDALSARYDELKNFCAPFCGMEKVFDENAFERSMDKQKRDAQDCDMLLAQINEINLEQKRKDFVSKMAEFGIIIPEPSIPTSASSKDADEKSKPKPEAQASNKNTADTNSVSSDKPKPAAIVEAISQDELDDIPKYMKGRLALEDINKIVDCIDKYMMHKRKLLRAPMKQLSLNDRDKVAAWKSEINDGGNGMFINEVECRSLLPDKSRLHLKNVLPILRHLGRTKEVRNKGGKIIIHAV